MNNVMGGVQPEELENETSHGSVTQVDGVWEPQLLLLLRPHLLSSGTSNVFSMLGTESPNARVETANIIVRREKS